MTFGEVVARSAEGARVVNCKNGLICPLLNGGVCLGLHIYDGEVSRVEILHCVLAILRGGVDISYVGVGRELCDALGNNVESSSFRTVGISHVLLKEKFIDVGCSYSLGKIVAPLFLKFNRVLVLSKVVLFPGIGPSIDIALR